MKKGDTPIRCPGCKRIVISVTKAITSYFDPFYSCKCGHKGGLRWTRKS